VVFRLSYGFDLRRPFLCFCFVPLPFMSRSHLDSPAADVIFSFT
jgi:hypothetical protein